jgi:hypothetical protein
MHYHVVEPHSDDAFLSLHAHMLGWLKQGHGVTIHTYIPVARGSFPEAKAYADHIGAKWKGHETVRVVRGEVATPIQKLRLGKDDQLILPLAIKHPDHWLVRSSMETPKAHFYVDQPYACTQSSSDRVTELLTGMRVVSYVKPHSRKYRLCSIFKAQGKFFYFNPPEDLAETFEMIVRR